MELLERIYKRLLAHTDTDFYRYLYGKIDWSQPLIGIKGQRGVGKTTMMLQRIKTTDPKGEKSFYASLDGRYLFEVGGKGKGFAQIRNIPDSFVVADDIDYGFGNKIPLWLFGFLY